MTPMPADVLTGRLTRWLEDLVAALEQNARYRLARRFVHRNEHVVPPLLFFGGVTWDTLTLQHVGALADNLILGLYVAALGGFVVLAILDRSGRPLPDPLKKLGTWAPSAIQFLAGGLFSAYVIYTTRSASFSSDSLFLLVLVAVLVANEIIWSRNWSPHILIGVYFLAVFCYFIFLLPALVGSMGFGIFLVSGFISVELVFGLVLYLDTREVFESTRSFAGALGIIFGLLALVVFFYANHWIPPVPLALRDGGVYHDVQRENQAFVLKYENPPWYRPWTDDESPFYYAPGDTVYCFAAVFAPTAIETDIYHRWQYYDPRRAQWVETDRIGYELVGGRRNGYRGVTYKTHVRPGEWRVTVETADRRPIGRIRFDIAPSDTTREPTYVTRRYQ